MLSRRESLRRLTLTAAGMVAGPVLAAATKPIKKGWCGSNAELHKLFGVGWFYNWNPNERGQPGGPEWVPMLKGAWAVNEQHFERVRRTPNITALLGFNEPERKDQGNTTLADALAAWPQVVALAEAQKLRLGSPATSSDGGGMKWFKAFMDEVKRQRLRVDFIAVHWYRSRKADEFVAWLKELDREYRRPIWITEFNGWTPNGNDREHHDFLRDALRYLERAPSIERYAYFNSAPGSVGSLLKADGTPSKMGELYQQAGG